MKKREAWIVPSILAVATLQMATNGISPILADLAEAFPQAEASTIQFLMTFPCLFIITAGLLGGTLARSVPKKWLILVGNALVALGGLLAWQVHGSLTVLFLWEALIGIGVGLSIPQNMGLIIDLMQGERRATVMGMAASFANLGAMLMIFVGGYLALIHWSWNYLVYLIALPGMVLSYVALPNRVTGAEASAPKGSSGGALALLKNPLVLMVLAIGFCSTMLFNTTPTNLSMRIAELALGNSAQAGLGSSLLLLSGTISCMFYGKLSQRLGNYTLVLGFGLMFLGQLICALAPNIWLIYLGCLIGGASHGNNMAHCLMLGARYSRGSSMTTSLVTAVSNTGAFCTPVLTILAQMMTGNTLTAHRFLLSALCAVTIALCIGAINRKGLMQ